MVPRFTSPTSGQRFASPTPGAAVHIPASGQRFTCPTPGAAVHPRRPMSPRFTSPPPGSGSHPQPPGQRFTSPTPEPRFTSPNPVRQKTSFYSTPVYICTMQKDHLRKPFELVLKELMDECPRGLAQRLELILQNAGQETRLYPEEGGRQVLGDPTDGHPDPRAPQSRSLPQRAHRTAGRYPAAALPHRLPVLGKTAARGLIGSAV